MECYKPKTLVNSTGVTSKAINLEKKVFKLLDKLKNYDILESLIESYFEEESFFAFKEYGKKFNQKVYRKALRTGDFHNLDPIYKNMQDHLMMMKRLYTKKFSFKTMLFIINHAQKRSGFRKKQNWIGKKGCKIDEAYFYPPDPKEVMKHMKRLVSYWKKDLKHPFCQIACFFAQFLIIHPFMDGNGKCARALVPLFFIEKKLFPYPLILLTKYFKKNQLDYAKELYLITVNESFDDWVIFFLKGVIENCKNILDNMKKKASHSI